MIFIRLNLFNCTNNIFLSAVSLLCWTMRTVRYNEDGFLLADKLHNGAEQQPVSNAHPMLFH